MSDYTDNMRAKVEASARASVAFARASAWGRLYDVASRLAAYLGAYGTVEAKSGLGALLLDALRGIDGDNWCPGLMPASPPLHDGWRDVIKRLRGALGSGGGVGVAGAYNAEVELRIGGVLLDTLEEELESLASHPLAARPVAVLSDEQIIEIAQRWVDVSGPPFDFQQKDLLSFVRAVLAASPATQAAVDVLAERERQKSQEQGAPK